MLNEPKRSLEHPGESMTGAESKDDEKSTSSFFAQMKENIFRPMEAVAHHLREKVTSESLLNIFVSSIVEFSVAIADRTGREKIVRNGFNGQCCYRAGWKQQTCAMMITRFLCHVDR
jgi:hypothetical protein